MLVDYVHPAESFAGCVLLNELCFFSPLSSLSSLQLFDIPWSYPTPPAPSLFSNLITQNITVLFEYI